MPTCIAGSWLVAAACRRCRCRSRSAACCRRPAQPPSLSLPLPASSSTWCAARGAMAWRTHARCVMLPCLLLRWFVGDATTCCCCRGRHRLAAASGAVHAWRRLRWCRAPQVWEELSVDPRKKTCTSRRALPSLHGGRPGVAAPGMCWHRPVFSRLMRWLAGFGLALLRPRADRRPPPPPCQARAVCEASAHGRGAGRVVCTLWSPRAAPGPAPPGRRLPGGRRRGERGAPQAGGLRGGYARLRDVACSGHHLLAAVVQSAALLLLSSCSCSRALQIEGCVGQGELAALLPAMATSLRQLAIQHCRVQASRSQHVVPPALACGPQCQQRVALSHSPSHRSTPLIHSPPRPPSSGAAGTSLGRPARPARADLPAHHAGGAGAGAVPGPAPARVRDRAQRAARPGAGHGCMGMGIHACGMGTSVEGGRAALAAARACLPACLHS